MEKVAFVERDGVRLVPERGGRIDGIVQRKDDIELARYGVAARIVEPPLLRDRAGHCGQRARRKAQTRHP